MASNGIGDLGQYDFMNKGMYPGSQIDRSYYATPTQVPLGAQAAIADYDPHTNPLTGQPVSRFADGGIAALRYNGEDGSQIETPAPEETKPPTMGELAQQIKEAYRSNQNYDDLWKQFAATKEQDPKEWYKKELEFLGNQQGWQIGQNRSDRLEALQPQLTNTVADAKAAGLNDKEINSILGTSSQEANMANQRRIAEEGAKGQGWVNQNIPGGWTTVGAAAALAAAPYAYGALAGSGGGFGISALPGASSTLGTLAAPGAAGTTFGITGGALGAGVPASLMVPTTGALVGGAGAVGGSSLGKIMATKMALETIAGGAGGSGGQSSPTSAGPSSTTSYIPFNPNQGQSNTRSLADTYNPTSANAFAIPGMTNGYYGYQPQTFNYGINPRRGMAAGGIAELAAGGGTNLGSYSDGGHLLKGPGDGMSDHIPATIGGQQPARLAEGEFVVPADVVSHLGNGSTDAGAKQLYKMMDKIRKARTGNAKQGKQINPDKFFPKG